MVALFSVFFTLALVLAAGALFTAWTARAVERRFPPKGHFMAVEGAQLHVVDVGPADPAGTVVLLHGAASNLVETMLGLGYALSRRYRVIAIDRPGHGWSSRPETLEAAEPERQAAAIAEALRVLKVRDAVIVGHSWSGTVVPHFGLEHRDVAGALLIIGGITSPWPGGTPGWMRRLTGSWVGWLLTRTLALPILLLFKKHILQKTFAPQRMPPGFLDAAAIPLAFRPQVLLADGHDLAVMDGAVRRQSPRYRDIRLPLTVIAGECDEIVWTDLHSRSIAREVPGAELILLPGLGHMPHYADPTPFFAAIDALAARIAQGTVSAPEGAPTPPQE